MGARVPRTESGSLPRGRLRARTPLTDSGPTIKHWATRKDLFAQPRYAATCVGVMRIGLIRFTGACVLQQVPVTT